MDDEFLARYEAYERAALDEYLRHAKSEEELRELIASLIERRSLLRDFEVAKLREEASSLLDKLHENCHRKLVEELGAFKDVLALQKRLLELNGSKD